MLISCTSCYSKFLVNSADLKPNGRTVQCANCGNQWHQESIFNEEEEVLLSSVPETASENENNDNESHKPVINLPSTYVRKKKVSVLNSFLVILLIIFLALCVWSFRNLEMNTLVLLGHYFNEFYFNLKLIINDIAKTVHQIIN
jgi:predicted Zn finger-like uncharacterized protein